MRNVLIVLGLTLGGVAAACGGSGDDDVARQAVPAAATDAASTTTAPSVDEAGTVAELEALAERYWVVTFELNAPPQPDSPRWDEIGTPALADGLRGLAADRIAVGTSVAYVGPPDEMVIGVVVDQRNESAATVDLCLRDETVEYDLATDEVVQAFFVFSHKRMEAAATPAGWRMNSVATITTYPPDERDACVDALGRGEAA